MTTPCSGERLGGMSISAEGLVAVHDHHEGGDGTAHQANDHEDIGEVDGREILHEDQGDAEKPEGEDDQGAVESAFRWMVHFLVHSEPFRGGVPDGYPTRG